MVLTAFASLRSSTKSIPKISELQVDEVVPPLFPIVENLEMRPAWNEFPSQEGDTTFEATSANPASSALGSHRLSIRHDPSRPA